MTLTIEIPSDIESQIFKNALRGDKKAVQKLLIDVITPTVESIIAQAETDLSDAAFEKVSEQLVKDFSTSSGSDYQPLSDYAISRKSIYANHP